jgi:hypothetical protein
MLSAILGGYVADIYSSESIFGMKSDNFIKI